MSDNFAPEISIPVSSEVADLVRGSLAPKNSVGVASVEFYEAVLEFVGVDPETLSFAEVVEVTRRLYGPSADFRRDRADIAKAEREAKAAEAREIRNAERAARDVAKIEEIEKRLAALRSGG
jgi:L-fucose isomerase-like protein